MAPRNVGLNSTFNEQRLVINELSVDVDDLLNAGYATTSYVGTVTSGLTSVSYVDNKVAISTSGLASVSYVDNKVAISTSGLLTPTSSGSSLTGIVTSITAGSGISIDQSTGNVTITSLGGAGGENLDQTLDIGNTSSKGMSIGVVTATSFVKSGGTSSQFLKADGSVDSNSYLTSISSGSSLTGIVTSITAGSGISIDQSTGNVTITSLGGGGGESYWVSTAAGIHTLSNVGIGTTNPLTALDIAAGTITFGRITGPYYGDVSIGNTLTSYGYTEGGFGVNNPRYKNNIFIGNEVYSLHSSGVMPAYNVVIGDRAGRTLGEGCTENVIIGRDAGYVNAGNGNNFIGMRAGEYNTSGYINNFIGYDAGNSNTTGGYNNFIGNEAGYTNTTGNNNFYGGQYTGYYNQGGNYNLALGSWAANGFSGSNTTQSYNIHLGAVNGGKIEGSYQVLIGSGNASGNRYFDLPNPNKSYQFAVGIRTDANPSKYWLVGDENFNVGIGTTNPSSKLSVVGNVNVSGAVTLSGFIFDSDDPNYYFNPKKGGNLISGFYITNDPVSYNAYLNLNDDQIYAYDGVTGGSFDIRSKRTENSFIDGGNLGIGTDNPTAKLDVRGDVNISGVVTATGNLSDGKGNVRAVPANSQTTSYTLTSSDTGKHINITTGGVTVPSGVFSVGDTMSIYNNSSSNQTITQGGSVTMYLAGTATTGNRTLAQRGLCTILCVSSNTFVILGGGLT